MWGCGCPHVPYVQHVHTPTRSTMLEAKDTVAGLETRERTREEVAPGRRTPSAPASRLSETWRQRLFLVAAPRADGAHRALRRGVPVLLQRGALALEHEHLPHPRLGCDRAPAVRGRVRRGRVLERVLQDDHVDGGQHRLPRRARRLPGRDLEQDVYRREAGVAGAADPAVGPAAVHHRADVARDVQLRVRRRQPVPLECLRRWTRSRG